MQTILFETKLLVAATRKGYDKYWIARVIEEEGKVYKQAEYWQVTDKKGEGEHQLSKVAAKGKNIGKSNETTPKDQAISEVISLYKKQQDKGYYNHGEKPPEDKQLLPTLAQDYKKIGTKLDREKLYAYQPKLDGERIVTDGTLFWTRHGKFLPDDITKHLVLPDLPAGVILDGELILPRPYTFQETMKAVKKYRDDITPKLGFHIFDCYIPELTFKERIAFLVDYLASNSKDNNNVFLVDTLFDQHLDDVDKFLTSFINDGHEGVMIRDQDSFYEPNFRSRTLVKYKEFMDEEFIIIDVAEGVGKEEGCAIFKCTTQDKLIFDVRPTGTTEYRKFLFNRQEELIGKQITVIFQNYTDEGIPRFPVGKGIRDSNGESYEVTD